MIGNVKPRTGRQLIDEIDEESKIDLEEYILDQISEWIIQKFKGYKWSESRRNIKAKGYTIYKSPEGADHGVDILASLGHWICYLRYVFKLKRKQSN